MSENGCILLIEDDPVLREEITLGLSNVGFAVRCAVDGMQGESLWRQGGFSLVILDLNLPKRDGWSLLADQERPNTPVIILTARTDLNTRVRAFEAGAVDYLAKPFFLAELIARVRARHKTDGSGGKVVRLGEAVVDLVARTLTLGNQAVSLTRTEFDILAYLLLRPGRAVSRTTLAERASLEEGERLERTIDSHVSRLRQKLGPAAASIHTVWGIGWRFEAQR
jgi:DNA-binding response OmpR family regulator